MIPNKHRAEKTRRTIQKAVQQNRLFADLMEEDDYDDDTRPFFKGYDYMRSWKRGGYVLHLFDADRSEDGKHYIGYQFFDTEWAMENSLPIFQGEDIAMGMYSALDSDGAVYSVLSRVLHPAEYDWHDDRVALTDRQRSWHEDRAEHLADLVAECRKRSVLD